ncbi:hypothetical protein BJ912DRAFT_922262 [Pholiota molesta]|nr:hypothetical protein BJ912DRAFT_922262 [Pholiota molesta]
MSGPQTANAHAQVQGSNDLPPIPPYEPVTLTWDPSALYPEEGTSSSHAPIAPGNNERRPTTSRPFNLHSLEGAVPADAPPSYNVARIPNYPVTYTFSSLGPTTGAMILVPPPDSPDTRPLYHISVSHDPFLPHCRITSVLQGGSVNGSYVGGFTSISGIEDLKKDAETHTTLKRKGLAYQTFEWYSFNSKRALKWTTSTSWPKAGPSTCVLLSDPKKAKVAEFTPFAELRRRGQPVLENTLTVMPVGHSHLDDILISALLLERRRRMETLTNAPWTENLNVDDLNLGFSDVELEWNRFNESSIYAKSTQLHDDRATYAPQVY